jgi:TfoX/Sxy family transcriptional regulator of competence genes
MKRPDECANAGWKIDTILKASIDQAEEQKKAKTARG